MAIVSASTISAIAPMSTLAGAKLPDVCPEELACSAPPPLAQCGDVQRSSDVRGSANWWDCPSQRLVIFSVRSSGKESGLPSAHWVIKSDPRPGGGLFVFPVFIDEKGALSKGRRLDLITFRSRGLINPTTPTIGAPFPVEFLESEIKRAVGGGETVELDDEQEIVDALNIYANGVSVLGLDGRTTSAPFLIRRSISGEIQQVILILFWIFMQIAACRIWVGNSERRLLKKYESKNSSERGRTMLDKLAESGSTGRSDVLAGLSHCATLWLDKGVALANVPALVDLERESIGRTWDHEYAPFKFILWAVPSIGFVGTVIGISQSMMLTAGLASPDEGIRVGARGAISSSISVAFDTTLVALLAAIVLMLVFLALQAKENGALEAARNFVVSLLSGQPPETLQTDHQEDESR